MALNVGDFYENCQYHPMILLEKEDDDLRGISLITGEEDHCSESMCGIVPMTLQEAITRRILWPQFETVYEAVREMYIKHLPNNWMG